MNCAHWESLLPPFLWTLWPVPSWPHKSQCSLLTLATRWSRAVFDHTLMWRCYTTATSCCLLHLQDNCCDSTYLHLSDSMLPAANNKTFGCEHKQVPRIERFEMLWGEVAGVNGKASSRQELNPRHLVWAASALPQSDNNWTNTSPHNPVCTACLFTLPHNI